MDYQKYMKSGSQGGVAAGDGKDSSDKKADDTMDLSKAQGAAPGGDHKQYIDYSKSMKGGAEGGGAGGDYKQYMDYSKYVKGGSQGGSAGGDYKQDMDYSKYMQGQTLAAVGDGKDASGKKADDTVDASKVDGAASPHEDEDENDEDEHEAHRPWSEQSWSDQAYQGWCEQWDDTFAKRQRKW